MLNRAVLATNFTLSPADISNRKDFSTLRAGGWRFSLPSQSEPALIGYYLVYAIELHFRLLRHERSR